MPTKTNSLPRLAQAYSPDQPPLILADKLGIKYAEEKEKVSDFKTKFQELVSFKKEKKIEPVWALKEVSFAAYPGDILGVIGPNGAGKTTLCRTILGLIKPDQGTIDVRGQVTSLLSLGTGFNVQFSGRQNIWLNGLMLGISRRKLKQLMPAIEEFTGLGRFLDYPIKYYSNGMKARLGFSIVAALEPEIIVIDEILGTGDIEFKARAVEKIKQLVSGSKMVLVVTHDLDFVEENCTRALWLDKGQLAACGDPCQVAGAYQEKVNLHKKPQQKIVSLAKTHEPAGKEETVRVEGLGIKFKLGEEEFWALKDINLRVHDQEILGIIGPNGAGKTTLCRALCGIYRPDRGSVWVNGEITALLSFGLGFNMQLTGYDNIYLNGIMMGIPKKVIRRKEKEIISFAELDRVIMRPIKKYSSGMRSRLGFSIAATLNPDVFVVDEALSAGDISFREKATARMREMLGEAKTVVLVTHSLALVEKACTRVIWLQKGTLQYDGDPKIAVELYKQSVIKFRRMKSQLPLDQDIRLQQAVKYFGDGQYEIAEDLFDEFLRDHPQNIEVLKQYAEIAESLSNWSEARERWAKVLQAADPGDDQAQQLAKKRIREIDEKMGGFNS